MPRPSKPAKRSAPVSHGTDAVFAKIHQILDAARSGIARTVNSTQVIANWLVGREIVQAEQSGSAGDDRHAAVEREVRAGRASSK